MRKFLLLVAALLAISTPLNGLVCPDTGALCASGWTLQNPGTVFTGYWKTSGYVSFTGGTAQVTISWHGASANVTGYNIYSGLSQSGPWSQVNLSLSTGSIYSDSSAAPGQLYYYFVGAFGAKGNLLASSNEVAITVPTF